MKANTLLIPSFALMLFILSGCNIYITPDNYQMGERNYDNRTRYITQSVLYGTTNPQVNYKIKSGLLPEHFVRTPWPAYHAPKNIVSNEYTTSYRKIIKDEIGRNQHQAYPNRYQSRTIIRKSQRINR